MTGRRPEPDAAAAGERFHGRRHGRRLRPGRAELLKHLLPQLAIALPPGTAMLDPAALFGFAPREIWLEIGFGAGEHLAAQALANPEVGLIGCEPFVNGVAGLLARLRAQGSRNVRIWPEDARLLLPRLPAAGLGRLMVLFPDPWPKARHRRRRIVQAATVARFAELLAPGGELRLASDEPGQIRWMLCRLAGEPRLRWTARTARDWRERPADWPPTRYEAKARAAGRAPAFLRFRRLGPGA